jgi:hypothetical protein
MRDEIRAFGQSGRGRLFAPGPVGRSRGGRAVAGFRRAGSRARSRRTAGGDRSGRRRRVRCVAAGGAPALCGRLRAVLRDAAVGALAGGAPLDGAALASRALALNRFDDGAHELLVRCLARGGRGQRRSRSCRSLRGVVPPLLHAPTPRQPRLRPPRRRRPRRTDVASLTPRAQSRAPPRR